MHKILVIDDEDNVRYSFKKFLREPDYAVHGAKDGPEALAMLDAFTPDLIILDIQLPRMSGLEVLQRVKEKLPKIPVLIITAFSTSERVITAMKYGAYEYIEKPFDIPRMKELIQEGLEIGRLMRSEVQIKPQPDRHSDADFIIGKSQAIKEVCKMIGRVARSDVNVLLTGESGTGKELVARAIYQNSQRAAKSFLAVNCAAIPETLLESELFGYEKGAFTGAVRRKIGKFQLADEGTIFLDEIGDMNPSTQAKILRVLQEGTFERVGGEETIRVDVRVIAAANQNLEKLIQEKKFREDLYYRIKVITMTLPPLRVRREDIPELAMYFLNRHLQALHKEQITLTPDGLQKLTEYEWPGNVRELENFLKRAILLSQGNVISADFIARNLPAGFSQSSQKLSDKTAIILPADWEKLSGKLYDTVIGEVEKDLILRVLQKVDGNQVRAAKMLGISRVMLHDRMEKYHIKAEVVVGSGSEFSL